MRIAVIDDWQNAARTYADWSPLTSRAEVSFLTEPLDGEDAAAAALSDFDIILSMRERTPFPPSLVARLPKLKMFGMTGHRAKAIDIQGLLERGVTVCYTAGGESGADTAELTLGLIIAAARRIPEADAVMRAGRFTGGVGPGLGLAGRTLGLVGLGRIGSIVCRYGRALDMDVIAWSRNLTAERAAAQGATAVSRDELFARADVVSLHVYLSPETEGLIGAADLDRMKPGAILVNTSRARLVNQPALAAALREERIFAAMDVYDPEPPAADHPARSLPNTVLTPHIGYCTDEVLRIYYSQTVENAVAFLDGAPVRTHKLAAA